MEQPLKQRFSKKVLKPIPIQQMQWSKPARMTHAQTQAVAARLRREIITESEFHEDAFADANLLMELARKKEVIPEVPPPQLTSCRTRVWRFSCGNCEDCMIGDCGTCANCLDKPKFGGPGTRKRACTARRCMHPKMVERKTTAPKYSTHIFDQRNYNTHQ
tara:strand:+ start:50 stop:532 length:483 start_codon:yes stop_codon:yes gene_type:complete